MSWVFSTQSWVIWVNNLKNKAQDLKNDDIKTPADIKLLGEIKDILKANLKNN